MQIYPPFRVFTVLVVGALLTVSVFADRRVPEFPGADEKIRLLIDTDLANEIDDLYALALVLACQDRFDIEGIVAAHWGDAGGPGGLDASYDLILEFLQVAGLEEKIPVYKGSHPFRYSAQIEPSEGVDFIIERAMDTSDNRPLWVVSLGACTNIAMAWIKEPAIKDRVISLWHGRTQWPVKCWNFNAFNDLKAVRVMMASELPLILFDTGTYLRAPMDYTEQHIAPHGPLGAYLHAYRFRRDWYQSPTKGFFDLGDIAVLIDPSLTEWETVEVPEVTWDMLYHHSKKHGKMLRVYQIRTEPTFELLSDRLEAFAAQSK